MLVFARVKASSNVEATNLRVVFLGTCGVKLRIGLCVDLVLRSILHQQSAVCSRHAYHLMKGDGDGTPELFCSSKSVCNPVEPCVMAALCPTCLDTFLR